MHRRLLLTCAVCAAISPLPAAKGGLLLITQPLSEDRFVDEATKISVVYAGAALVMPVRGYNDLGPIDLGMEVGINTYRTETGQIAGRFVDYAGLMGNLSFNHLPKPWVRSTLIPLLKKVITTPFFVATRPSGYPDDCAYAWTTENVIPQRMRLKNYMSVQMKVHAHAPVSLF